MQTERPLRFPPNISGASQQNKTVAKHNIKWYNNPNPPKRSSFTVNGWTSLDSSCSLKEDCVVFREDIKALNLYWGNYTNSEILFPYVTNELLSEENKVEHCLKLEKWQGPPHVNKEKLYKCVLFGQFVYSVMKTKRDWLFSLFRQKK